MARDNVVEIKSACSEETPSVVGVNVTAGALDYLRRLAEQGTLEGPVGNQSVSQELRPIIEALHHVLSGGEVDVKVVKRGNSKMVGELDGLFARSFREGNEINSAANYRVVPLVI